MKDTKVIIITGPTASGKSELAYNVAKKLNAEIILADTRCMYKDLNYGVSKPINFMKDLKYHLVSFLEPYQVFSAYDFYKAVVNIVNSSKKPIIIEGGSIFYIKAVIEENLPDIYVPNEIKEMVKSLDDSKALDMLKKLDPVAISKIDVKNTRRVKRALEIKLATGKSKYDFTGSKNSFQKLVFKLQLDFDYLEKRIMDRLDNILPHMIEETKLLLSKGVGFDAPIFLSSGYKAVIDFIYGKFNIDELKKRVFIEHRKLAKKQIVFLKKLRGIEITEPEPVEVISVCR
ncbi:MAG: tRNA (adenosine(37)-N6)-dimethylallyltransferase MiaA, partial [bacterium]|nr:tRNA (adenosine(37)-N6)-dimethylallyltransferase MiaA [bacterium]